MERLKQQQQNQNQPSQQQQTQQNNNNNNNNETKQQELPPSNKQENKNKQTNENGMCHPILSPNPKQNLKMIENGAQMSFAQYKILNPPSLVAKIRNCSIFGQFILIIGKYPGLGGKLCAPQNFSEQKIFLVLRTPEGSFASVHKLCGPIYQMCFSFWFTP